MSSKFKNILINYPVILASGSQRRQELLKQCIAKFEIVVPDIDESKFINEDPWLTAQYTARAKAFKVFDLRSDSLIIAADTIVALPKNEGFNLFFKPENKDEAREMLLALSDKEHLVITGVSIRTPNSYCAFSETTKLTFKNLTSDEIENYLSTGEYQNKAGSYGIQGKARSFIKEIKGPIDNVIGLPLDLLIENLRVVNQR